MTHFFSGLDTMDLPLVSGGESKGVINNKGVSFGLYLKGLYLPQCLPIQCFNKL